MKNKDGYENKFLQQPYFPMAFMLVIALVAVLLVNNKNQYVQKTNIVAENTTPHELSSGASPPETSAVLPVLLNTTSWNSYTIGEKLKFKYPRDLTLYRNPGDVVILQNSKTYRDSNPIRMVIDAGTKNYLADYDRVAQNFAESWQDVQKTEKRVAHTWQSDTFDIQNRKITIRCSTSILKYKQAAIKIDYCGPEGDTTFATIESTLELLK